MNGTEAKAGRAFVCWGQHYVASHRGAVEPRCCARVLFSCRDPVLRPNYCSRYGHQSNIPKAAIVRSDRHADRYGRRIAGPAFTFEGARRLTGLETGGKPVLTDRQRDCVLWAARGKTEWEIVQNSAAE